MRTVAHHYERPGGNYRLGRRIKQVNNIVIRKIANRRYCCTCGNVVLQEFDLFDTAEAWAKRTSDFLKC